MNLKNKCEGCKAYSDRESKGMCLACNTPSLSDTIKCPCVICLVKGICVVSCKEFKIYADKVYKHYGGIEKAPRIRGDIREGNRYEIKRSM